MVKIFSKNTYKKTHWSNEFLSGKHNKKPLSRIEALKRGTFLMV
jgi:hypothetical protein